MNVCIQRYAIYGLQVLKATTCLLINGHIINIPGSLSISSFCSYIPTRTKRRDIVYRRLWLLA